MTRKSKPPDIPPPESTLIVSTFRRTVLRGVRFCGHLAMDARPLDRRSAETAARVAEETTLRVLAGFGVDTLEAAARRLRADLLEMDVAA